MAADRMQTLADRLSAEHQVQPFRPSAPREAARRVLGQVQDLGMAGVVLRGGLDVGAAEVDHLWVLVDDEVVDVTLPLHAERFVPVLRSWVAGDVDDRTLDEMARPFGMDRRVVSVVPGWCSYRGRPVLHHRRP